MTTSENRFLFKEKINEGKGELQAIKEIRELDYSQKQFKIMYKENQALKIMLKNKDIELEKLRRKSFKDLRNPSPTQIGRIELNRKKEYTGTFKHLGRLINHMEVGKLYTKKELGKELCMSGDDLNACLYFLNDHHLMNLEFPNVGVIRK